MFVSDGNRAGRRKSGWQLLNSMNLEGLTAVSDITSFSIPFDEYNIELINVLCSTAAASTIGIRVLTRGSFQTTGYNSGASTSATIIRLSTGVVSTSVGIHGRVVVYNPSSPLIKKMFIANVCYQSAASSATFAINGGAWDIATDPIQGFQVTNSSTITMSGIVNVFGVAP